jgi:hypothetical protein
MMGTVHAAMLLCMLLLAGTSHTEAAAAVVDTGGGGRCGGEDAVTSVMAVAASDDRGTPPWEQFGCDRLPHPSVEVVGRRCLKFEVNTTAVAFMHIGKAGGTAFRTMLLQSLGDIGTCSACC